jgi:putative hydrolase of the HAD superfamily
MRERTIITDLGNVILRFDMDICVSKVADACNITKHEVFTTLFDSELPRLHEEGRLSGYEFYARASRLLNINLSFEDFRLFWSDIFFENNGIRPAIRRLRESYPVFLLSNVGELHFEHIERKFSISADFDEIILSYKVGARKPHESIYKYAIEKARCPAHSIIYFDDREDLVEAAKKLGIRAYKFENLEGMTESLRSENVKIT